MLAKVLILFGAFLCYYCANAIGSNNDDDDDNVGVDGVVVDLFPDLPVGIIDTENVLCRDHSILYAQHLRNLSLWAHEMHDATAKSVTGLLRGSISQFGHFEECLSAKAPFKTQYCLATMIAHVPEPNPSRDPKSLAYEPDESVLRKIYDKQDPSQQPENVVLMGWCLPASCRREDMHNYLNKYLSNVAFPLKEQNVTYTSEFNENSCQTYDEIRQYDHVDFSFGLVVIIIAILVASSSIFDALRNSAVDKLKPKSQFTKLLLTFSIKRNFQKLPFYEESNSALMILYGIRVFCIIMIIMDHRFGTHLSSGILNFNTVEEQYRSSFGTLFFHGDLFVDSFFILSGLLVTYCLLIQYDKRFMNPVLLLFMRYIRLTPLYAFVIFYYATLLKYTGSGPMWKTIIAPEIEDCRTNWWTNLLYISNYVNVDRMCMVHSWYLPCDFHFFIIAIFICILIHKNKRIGLTFLGAVTLLSIVIPFIIIMMEKLPAVILFYPDFLRLPKQQREFILAYCKSHARASPYFIGMIAGYLYYRMRGSGKCLKRTYSHIILIVSVIVMVTSIVTGMIFYHPEYKYDPVESALYAALHRTFWSLGSIGLFYVASYGNAKIIYRFLSWKPWVALSKLVYGAYLVHMQFQLRSVARKAGADATTYYDIISMALSDIVLSFGTSFLLYLAIEAPFRNIFSLLLIPQKDPTPKLQTNNTNNGINNNTITDTTAIATTTTAKENISDATCDSHL